MMTANNTLIFINGYQIPGVQRFKIDIDSQKTMPEGFISVIDYDDNGELYYGSFLVEDIDYKDNVFKLHIKILEGSDLYFKRYYEGETDDDNV